MGKWMGFGWVLLLCLVPAASLIFANGGPAGGSNIEATGNIQMMQKNNIVLDEEQINIELRGDNAVVNVDYSFTNHGKPDTITYGFPIDINYNPDLEAQYDNTGHPPVTGFAIRDETGALPVEKAIKQRSGGDLESGKSVRNWYFAKIKFPQGKKQLQVRYTVAASFGDWETSKDLFPRLSDRTFIYDLTPSKYWGNGIVKKFKVIFDPRANIDSGTKITKVNMPFKKNPDGLWIFETTGFDLAKAGSIFIRYDRTDEIFSDVIRGSSYRGKNYISNIKASSVLKGNYKAENLVDDDLDTAWAEGAKGDGVNEWVEFTVHKTCHLRAIGVMGGYMKSEKTYYENNRIKMLQVDIIDGEAEDGDVTTKYMKFKDLKYLGFHKDAFYPFVTLLDCFKNSEADTYKIRFTILEVYPGKVYQDTCISEIFLLSY